MKPPSDTMTDVFVCCICSMCRYRHDVVEIPDISSEEAKKQWKEAFGENNYDRVKKQKNPLACVEHFEGTEAVEAEGSAVKKSPIKMADDEREFVENFFNDHGYSKLCKEEKDKIDWRIKMDNVFCSVCSAESTRKNMVQHAMQHCSLSLKAFQFQCKAHQVRKQAPMKKTEEEVNAEQAKLTALEKANMNSHQTANCSDCLFRHQRIQQDRIRTQAAICFPLFTFKYNREAPQKSNLNTLIVGTISANYMKSRFRLRPSDPTTSEAAPSNSDDELTEQEKEKKLEDEMPEKLKNKKISYSHFVAKYFQTTVKKKEVAGTTSSSPLTPTKRPQPTEGGSAKKSKLDETAVSPAKEPKDGKPAILTPPLTPKLKPIKIRQVVVAGTKTVVMDKVSHAGASKTTQQPSTPKKSDGSSKESGTLQQNPTPESNAKISEVVTEVSEKNAKSTDDSPKKPDEKSDSSSAEADAAKKQRYEELKKKFLMRRAAGKLVKILPRPIKVVDLTNGKPPIQLQACPELSGRIMKPASTDSSSPIRFPIRIGKVFETPTGLPKIQLMGPVKANGESTVLWPKTVSVVVPGEKRPEPEARPEVQLEIHNQPVGIKKAQLMVESREPPSNSMNPRLEILLKNRTKPPKAAILKSLMPPPAKKVKIKVSPKKKVKKPTKKGSKVTKTSRTSKPSTSSKPVATRPPRPSQLKRLPTRIADRQAEDTMDWQDVDLHMGEPLWEGANRQLARKKQQKDDDDEYSELVWMSGPLKLRKMILQRFPNNMHPSAQQMLDMAEETKSKYRIIYENYDFLRTHNRIRCDKGDCCDRIKEYFELEMNLAPSLSVQEDLRDILDHDFEKHLKTGTNFTVGHVHVFAESTGLHPKTIRSRFSTVRQRFIDSARSKQVVQKMLPPKEPLSEDEKTACLLKEFNADHFPNPQKYIELAKYLDKSYEDVQRFYNTQRVRHINEVGMYDDVDILNKKKSEVIWAVARKPKVVNYDERIKLSIKLGISYSTVCYWLDNYIIQLQSSSNLMNQNL